MAVESKSNRDFNRHIIRIAVLFMLSELCALPYALLSGLYRTCVAVRHSL